LSKTEGEQCLEDALAHLHSIGGGIVKKEGWFWNAIHYFLMGVTLGSQRSFLTGYYTTIGPWVGVPKGWEKRSPEGRAAVIMHECKHIEQCKWFGFGNVFVGLPTFTILYLLLPLPMGLAYFRWRFERVAYTISINAKISMALDHQKNEEREYQIGKAVDQLSSGKYGWTWPFPKAVRRYFEEQIPEHLSLADIRMAKQGLIDRDVQ
jgi:hypothetical protein